MFSIVFGFKATRCGLLIQLINSSATVLALSVTICVQAFTSQDFLQALTSVKASCGVVKEKTLNSTKLVS